MRTLLLLMGCLLFRLDAQEASSGFDLRATASAEAIQSPQLSRNRGSADTAGFRAVLYPTWKMGKHWTMSAAIQTISRPYFNDDLGFAGHSVKTQVLQANLGYSQVWKNASLSVKAGQMPTAFGNFLLRYSDSDNPLVGIPVNYGYYGAAVNALGLMGVQLDATAGKWDARLQLANSSPANPRSIFDKDQYGNWAGGFGYTIFQGLRMGFSEYRGPYLDRQSPYFFPGESPPKDLPATAVGADIEWARGHWSVFGEWQHAVMSYHVIPDFRQTTAYVEARRVLHPRWYVAARTGMLANSVHTDYDSLEAAVGFRPAAHELLKTGYILERQKSSGQWSHTLMIQAVTEIHPLSVAWK